MFESFDIILLDYKIVVYYYKDGTLGVEGEEKNKSFCKIISQVNKIISKNDCS